MNEIHALVAVDVRFFSPYDEDAFFEWLGKLTCIIGIEGGGSTLHVRIDEALLDEPELRELLALFFRYGVDMKQLSRLDRGEFASWFRDDGAYWHKAVFG